MKKSVHNIKILESKRNFTVGSGANYQEISELEKKLNVFFPEYYKMFLNKYGYASWFGNHIYGISENPIYDLQTITQQLRNEKLPKDFKPYPDKAIPIRKYDGGGYYMLYSMDSLEPGNVVLVEDEAFNQIVDRWVSFEEFLKDQCY